MIKERSDEEKIGDGYGTYMDQLATAELVRPVTSVNSSNVMKDVLAATEEHWGQVSDEKANGVSSMTEDCCLMPVPARWLRSTMAELAITVAATTAAAAVDDPLVGSELIIGTGGVRASFFISSSSASSGSRICTHVAHSASPSDSD